MARRSTFSPRIPAQQSATVALLHALNLFLGNVASVYPATTTVYTVPAGDRIILRSVAVRNLSGSVGVQVYVLVDGIFVWTGILTPGSTSGGSQEWRPWVVVGPGSVIKMAVSATPGAGAAASGSIYTI